MEKQKKLNPKELLELKKKQAKVKKLRELAKKINQALLKESVEEAQDKISLLALEIDGQFNQRRLTTKVKDLKIKSNDVAGKELLKITGDLCVTEAVGMLNGFDNEIKAKIKKDVAKKTIEELNVELL